jgi:hypothetical protein
MIFRAKHRGQSTDLVARPAVLDCHVPALDETGIVQASLEARDTESVGFRRPSAKIADHWHRRLLRTCRERSGEGRAA